MQTNTMNRSSYIISLALGKVFLASEIMDFDTIDEIMMKENTVMENAYRQQNKHWKSPISVIFDFSECKNAELFAGAILNSHGVEPKIIIDYTYKMIEISSIGYAC